MKKLMISILTCGIVASSLYQANALTMRLSADGGASWIVVDDNGPFDLDTMPGSILYLGSIPGWSFPFYLAVEVPAVGTSVMPRMDLSVNSTANGPANLIVQMSDRNFVPFDNEIFFGSISANSPGTVTYNTFRDSGNILFGSGSTYSGDPLGVSPSPTAIPLVSSGPLNGGPNIQSNSAVVSVGGSTPYSLTLETLISVPSAGLVSVDALLFPLPPPDVACAATTGTVGTPYTSTIVASGGCLPYQNFSIISGSLPPGLSLNPTTGVISGIPTMAGTFPYAVRVTDNCANQADTLGGNCNITITGCPPCAPHDIQYNFNGTQIIFQPTTGGSYVWFIADGVVNGLPLNHKVVLHISDQTITIPAVGSSPQYVVPVPDAYITFDPAVVQATTTFDTVNNVWRMTFPPSGMSGNIFYGGTAFKVPVAGLPGGIKNVDWKGSFTTDTAGLTVHWQWHAANYKNFTSDMNAIAPKPTDDTSASIYKNSDHAGTPEGTDLVSGQPWKKFVIGGGSGGGGANYTGSGSSTISFAPCICPTP